MSVKKGVNNFAPYQRSIVNKNSNLIKAELKDISARSGMNFKDLDSLVRYISKVTAIHPTTLKRNTKYRLLLRDSLGRQHGSISHVDIDDAPPELLRAMIEERNMTIGNLINQTRILNEKINRFESSQIHPEVNANLYKENIHHTLNIPAPIIGTSHEAEFQDTAFALLQLIQHINQSAGVETIVIDEKENLILDMAILKSSKRREMAIGPERTKAFIRWVKTNKLECK